jgi:hypothetical protein
MRSYLFTLLLLSFLGGKSAQILLPMDDAQANHLKAYGITYWALQHGSEADWLLNYRGGSFSMPYSEDIEAECNIRGVSYEVLADGQYNLILAAIANPERNEDMVKLEKAPRICVYSPKTKQPWDDAVTLVLTYAEIPYEVVYDEEVLTDKLLQYDWLHLHHEDFTGQYGKFYASYRNAAWYQNEVAENETIAAKFGYRKVSELKLAVAKRIRDFVAGGGYLFAMCSATDTYDIALAAEGVDICDGVFDGDPADPSAQDKLNFDATFAFHDFTISRNPFEYEHSDIDATSMRARLATAENDYFSLFEFSAKWDPIPTMLTQCHTKSIKGFYGQTTTFTNATLKPSVLVMGEAKAFSEARYIHGEFGYGMWTFYGGHDPEDYRHYIGDPPTDLNLHPNSPGYRLILNNVLFPAARKKPQKT